MFKQQGSFREAADLWERILTWAEKTLGPEHPSTAMSINNLALFHDRLGDTARAETLYLRALAITEKVVGSDHPDTAISLNNLAGLYEEEGFYAKAEPLYLRVLAIRQKVFGAEHPRTAASLNNLALLYVRQGAHEKAEPLYRRALAILQKIRGPDHPDTAGILNNLAVLLQVQGAFARAEPLARRALAITEKALGPDHPSTAATLTALAGLYQSEGAYARAVPLSIRALAIIEKALGPDHPRTAIHLNNLALLYVRQGAHEKAEPLYRRSLAIKRKALGAEHPSTALSLNNLAGLYETQGAYHRAEPLYLRALAINEKALGPDHPSIAASLNNLAALYINQGTLARAMPLSRRALAITEKALGPDHPSTAFSLNTLATLYDRQGDRARAEPLHLRSLAIKRKALGAEHPSTAISLINLATLHLVQGQFGKATPLLQRAVASQSRFLQKELPLLPLTARDAQVRALSDAWQLAFTAAERSPGAADLALFSRLNRYGLLLEIERRQGVLLRAPGPLREQAQRLGALISQLAATDLPPERRQTLEQQRQSLERDLYRALPALQPRILEPTHLAAALPQGSVYLAFQRYRPFDAGSKPDQRWGDAHYLALVLHKDGSTQAVQLGPAAPIEALIRSALAATRSSSSDPAVIHSAWAAVNAKLFPPALLAALRNSRRWILSPDGELSRVPFLAIPSPLEPGDPQRRLAQSRELQLVSSGRDLVPDPNRPSPAPAAPLVLADPDFGPAPPGDWFPLPASAQEGRQIAALLQVQPRLGSQASKAQLRHSPRPKLLHIASHGFFSPPSQASVPSPRPPAGEALRSSLTGPPDRREDAMLNSAIVLADANRSPDAGTLTAREAAQLQLDGTQLVVLSACETALGEQRSGEGVYGLQRALRVAGARSTLLSLWKVPDDGTALFMGRFYQLLRQGKGRLEALQTVQEEFRSDPPCRQCSDPRYWAAWQLSGDTGPLTGL